MQGFDLLKEFSTVFLDSIQDVNAIKDCIKNTENIKQCDMGNHLFRFVVLKYGIAIKINYYCFNIEYFVEFEDFHKDKSIGYSNSCNDSFNIEYGQNINSKFYYTGEEYNLVFDYPIQEEQYFQGSTMTQLCSTETFDYFMNTENSSRINLWLSISTPYGFDEVKSEIISFLSNKKDCNQIKKDLKLIYSTYRITNNL